MISCVIDEYRSSTCSKSVRCCTEETKASVIRMCIRDLRPIHIVDTAMSVTRMLLCWSCTGVRLVESVPD
jgi:hypothetical protein